MRAAGISQASFELYPRMTGQRVLDWFAGARGGVDAAFRERTRGALRRDRSTGPIRELSKGNRQKLGLVLAFMHRPELLVLDEPTSGLDPLMQDEFHRLLRETTAEGRTVFLSSHELDEVQRVADRVAIIKQGRLVVTRLGRAAAPAGAADDRAALQRTGPSRRVRAPRRGQRVAVDGDRVTLQVTGELAPLLRVIADHEPVDVVARHADLDELFLTYYRDTPITDAD